MSDARYENTAFELSKLRKTEILRVLKDMQSLEELEKVIVINILINKYNF